MECLEYIAVLGSLTTRFLLATHPFIAVKLALLVSVLWILFSFNAGLYGILSLNIFYLFLDARTSLIWNKK